MASLRIEFIRLNTGARNNPNTIKSVHGVQTITTSTTSQQSAAAPAFEPLEPTGYARVTAIGGACYVAWGDSPIASATNLGIFLADGQTEVVPVKTDSKLAVILA